MTKEMFSMVVKAVKAQEQFFRNLEEQCDITIDSEGNAAAALQCLYEILGISFTDEELEIIVAYCIAGEYTDVTFTNRDNVYHITSIDELWNVINKKEVIK